MAIRKDVYAKRLREIKKDEHTALSAFEIAKTYHQIRGYKQPADMASFAGTKNFPHYMRLAKMFKEVGVPDIELYLRAMIHFNKAHTTWTTNHSYKCFLEYMDDRIGAEEAVNESVGELQYYAAKLEMTIPDLINFMTLSEITTLVYQRKLSPWFVLNSKLIKSKVNKASEAEQTAFINAIDADDWQIRFAKRPYDNQKAKTKTKEYDL